MILRQSLSLAPGVGLLLGHYTRSLRTSLNGTENASFMMPYTCLYDVLYDVLYDAYTMCIYDVLYMLYDVFLYMLIHANYVRPLTGLRMHLL